MELGCEDVDPLHKEMIKRMSFVTHNVCVLFIPEIRTLLRTLAWLLRTLAWLLRTLAWLLRTFAWLLRTLACLLGLGTLASVPFIERFYLLRNSAETLPLPNFLHSVHCQQKKDFLLKLENFKP